MWKKQRLWAADGLLLDTSHCVSARNEAWKCSYLVRRLLALLGELPRHEEWLRTAVQRTSQGVAGGSKSSIGLASPICVPDTIAIPLPVRLSGAFLFEGIARRSPCDHRSYLPFDARRRRWSIPPYGQIIHARESWTLTGSKPPRIKEGDG